MSENQHTEWKEVWRDDYLRWVCAFANAEGGTLVIGRNDQGEVVGLKNAAKLLDKLHLSEGSYLKRAAVLLFHPDAERFVTGAYLKMGYFENNVDLRYQDEVHGDLFTQVSQTMVLLQAKYLKAWISYEGLQRSETFAVPDAALREALLNAVVHKDYAVAAPIQISVYPDKLMIWNPGQLPPDWTLEKLLGKHASLPFNPDLANAFFRAGLIESWGRGMERIQRACHQAGVPTPDLSLDHGGLWVTFHFPPAPAAADEKTPVETPVQTLEETPAAMPLKTPDQILRILRQQPALSLAAVAQAIGKSTSAVERAVAKLGKSGQLRRVGATKTGRWEVLHEAGDD